MTRRVWIVLLLLLVGALCLASCSGNREEDATASTPAASESTPAATESTDDVAPSPQDETPEVAASNDAAPADDASEPSVDEAPSADDAAPETAVAETTPAAPTVAPAPQHAFSDAGGALDDLDSYRYTTSFVFVGEDGGEPESGSIELEATIASDSQKQFTWRDLETGDRFDLIRVGNQAWTTNNGEWEEVPPLVAEAMGQAVLVFAPSVVWSGLFGGLDPNAVYVGAETINGIPAHHYTATFDQWAGYWEGDLVDATGDVWIAEEGYPVKYHFSAVGVDEDGDRGAVTWTMELRDVNADIEIAPPAQPQ